MKAEYYELWETALTLSFVILQLGCHADFKQVTQSLSRLGHPQCQIRHTTWMV